MPGIAGSQPADLPPVLPEAPAPEAGKGPGLSVPVLNQTTQGTDNTPAPGPASAPDVDPLAQLAHQYSQVGNDSGDPLSALAKQYGGNMADNSDAGVEAQAADNGNAGFMSRVKAGFASNDEEKEAYLKQQYGESGVKKTPNGFFIKEDNKWKKFNNDWLGIGDPANLARQATVEASALPAEVGATAAAAGEVATAAGAPLAIPTEAAGRMIGGAAGETAAKAVAYGLIGIPNKETAVQQLTDVGMQGGVRAIFGHIFDHLSQHGLVDGFGKLLSDVVKPTEDIAKSAIDKFATQMQAPVDAAIARMNNPPKTWQETAQAALPEQKAAAGINDALELNQAAQQAGVSLRPDELFPNNPKMQEIADKSMSSQKMQDWVMKRGQQAATAIKQLGSAFRGSGESATDAVKAGSVVDRAWGKLIGSFRDKALAAAEAPTRELSIPPAIPTEQTFLSGLPQAQPEDYLPPSFSEKNLNSAVAGRQNTALNAMSTAEISSLGKQAAFQPGEAKTIAMNNFGKSLQDVRSQLGFQGTVPPPASAFADMATGLGMKKGDVSTLVTAISKLTDKMANNEGKLDPREVDQMYKLYKRFTDANAPGLTDKPSSVFQIYATMKNGLRDDFTTGIASLLSPEDKAVYQQAMQRFSKIKDAQAGVKQLLNTDSPSSDAIVQYLKNGATRNADRIADLKTIVQQEDPKGWENIGKKYFDSIMADHALSDASGQRLGGYDWVKLQKTLNPDKKGFQQLSEVIGGVRASQLSDLTDAMAAAQRSDREFDNPAIIARVVKAAKGAWNGDVTGVPDIFAADHNALKLLTSDKASQLISKLAAKDQETMSDLISRATGKAAQMAVKASPGLMSQQATSAIRNTQGRQPQQ